MSDLPSSEAGQPPAPADEPPSESNVAPAAAKSPRWLTFVRGVGFVILVSYFWSGLVGRQLMEIDSKYLPAWVMFGGAGVKRSQVAYWTVDEDGARQDIDAYEVLGLEPTKKSPKVFRIYGVVEAHRVGRKICRELGPGTDLRMKVRTAWRTRWKTEAKGTKNVCTNPPPRKKKKPKKKKPKKKQGKSA